jgi:hypothetical protein
LSPFPAFNHPTPQGGISELADFDPPLRLREAASAKQGGGQGVKDGVEMKLDILTKTYFEFLIKRH